MDLGDLTVIGVDHRQGGGVRFDEQQGGAGVARRAAHRLSQRGGGQERRHQHHVLDLVPYQGLAQRGGFGRVAPGHPGRTELIAALTSTFAGAQDRRDHPLRGALSVGADVEVVVLHRDPVGTFAFHQDHADRRGCNRYPENDVHSYLHPLLIGQY